MKMVGILPTDRVIILGTHKITYQNINFSLDCIKNNKLSKGLETLHELCTSTQSTQIRCIALFTMGSLYLDRFDDRQKAGRCLQLADSLLQTEGDTTVVADCLDPVWLRPLSRRVKTCMERLKNLRENLSGKIDLEEGFENWDPVNQSVTLVMGELERAVGGQGMAETLSRGLEYTKCGEYKSAIHVYLNALSDLHNSHVKITRYDILHLLLLIARGYKSLGELSKSTEFLQKAQTVLQRDKSSFFTYDIVLARSSIASSYAGEIDEIKQKVRARVSDVITVELAEVAQLAAVRVDVHLQSERLSRKGLMMGQSERIRASLELVEMFTDILNLRDAEKELDLISDLLLDTPPTELNSISTSVNTISTSAHQLQEDVIKTTAMLNREFQHRGTFESVLERWREIQTDHQNEKKGYKKLGFKKSGLVRMSRDELLACLESSELLLKDISRNSKSSVMRALCYLHLARISTQKGQFAAAKFHCRTALALCTRFVPDPNLTQLQSEIRELHKHCSESMAVIQQSVENFGKATQYTVQDFYISGEDASTTNTMQLSTQLSTHDLESLKSEHTLFGENREKTLSGVTSSDTEDLITEIEFETDFNRFTISTNTPRIEEDNDAGFSSIMKSRGGVMTSRDGLMTSRDRKVSFAAKIGVKEKSTTSTTSENPRTRNKFYDFMAADSFIFDKNESTDKHFGFNGSMENEKAVPPTPWLIRDMFSRSTHGKLSEFGELKISTQDQVIWGTTDTLSVFVWGLTTNLHAKFRERTTKGLGLGLGQRLSLTKGQARTKELRELRRCIQSCFQDARQCSVWIVGCGGERILVQMEQFLLKTGVRNYNTTLYDKPGIALVGLDSYTGNIITQGDDNQYCWDSSCSDQDTCASGSEVFTDVTDVRSEISGDL
ncbi:hypothetical protein ACHWQZ_G000416 [Mnemiopsis leidyi]